MMKKRTTISFDEDVLAKLQSVMVRTGQSFERTVNEILRLGFEAKYPPRAKKRFVVQARPMGRYPSFSYNEIGELLDQLEGPLAR